MRSTRLLTTASVVAALAAAGTASARTSAGAPVNTAPPALSGAPVLGKVLYATTGSWANGPGGYSYQFQDCDLLGGNCRGIADGSGRDVLGNTIDPHASWHTVRSYDLDHTIRVVVTATSAGGSASAASAATEPAVAGPPLSIAPPTIDPTHPVGAQFLVAYPGQWQDEYNVPDRRFSWYRCDGAGANCVLVSTALCAGFPYPVCDDSGYQLSAADAGMRIRVAELAANAAGQSTAMSAPTDPVAWPPTNVVPPSLTGSALVGQVVRASTGTWSGNPTGYTYTFQDCDAAGVSCVDIADGSGHDPLGNAIDPHASWHTVRSYDVGHTVRVVVTATNDAGSVSFSPSPTQVVH